MPKERLDVVLLNALQGLAWTPPGDSLCSSGPQLQKQFTYTSCLVTSFLDIVLDARKTGKNRGWIQILDMALPSCILSYNCTKNFPCL